MRIPPRIEASSALAAWVVAFSRAATRAAISSRVVSSTYVSMPRRPRLSLALQWIDTKRSAPKALARAVRSSSDTNWSSSRVRTTWMPCAASTGATRCATSRVTSFSLSPSGPTAPLSLPPWPGSSTTRETVRALRPFTPGGLRATSTTMRYGSCM